jgi:hypothetical protein
MKAIVALCLLAFPFLSYCATKRSDANELKTFVSPDGAFRFRYSQILFRCPQGNEPKDGSEPAGPCVGQIPICDDDDDSTFTIVCLAYPEGGPAFAVAEVKEAKTEGACLKGPEGWPMEMHGTRTIHGAKFKVFEVSTLSMGQGLDGELYRTFHLGKCYELGIRTIWSTDNEDETGNVIEPTKAEAMRVDNRLEECLKSFRFLR